MLKSAGADVIRPPPGALRPGPDRSAHRARAKGIHPSRAEPGAQSQDRGASPRFRLGGQRAQLVRPRGRATAWQQARLPELPPSRPEPRSIHFWGGYPVEPIDIHASVRHLEALFDMLTLSDKPIHAYSLGRERNPGRHRDGEDRPRDRRRDARTRAVAVYRHQLVVAAQARYADAGRGHPDGAAESGGGADALHSRRRDGPGDARRRPRPAACRSAGRARHDPGRRGPARHSSMAASLRTST